MHHWYSRLANSLASPNEAALSTTVGGNDASEAETGGLSPLQDVIIECFRQVADVVGRII